MSTVSSIKVAQDILNIMEKGSLDVKNRLIAFGASDVTAIQDSSIKYHPNCLTSEKKKFLTEPRAVQEDKYDVVNSEFLKKVKYQLLGENSDTADIKGLVELYENLIETAGLSPPVATMRRYVKSLLQSDEELMSSVDFYHFDPCKPTVVANKLFVAKLVCGTHFQQGHTDNNELEKVTGDIRKELSSMVEWEFKGSFGDYETPKKLLMLVKQIVSGSYSLSEKKQSEVDIVCNNITQYICSNFKSNRQLNYQSGKDRGFEKHRISPFSVGAAFVSYQANRSRSEIENWSRMGICINYDKLERMITSIAVSMLDEASRNGFGIVLPLNTKKGIRPIFAADNIDFGSDAKSFHGAD